jgi:MFS family permease
MVEFGKTLESARREEWFDYYIDYDRLKRMLNKAHKKKIKKDHSAANSLEMPDTDQEKKQQLQLQEPLPSLLAVLNFRHALDQEIEKVVLFLLNQQGTIAAELGRLAHERNQCVEEVSILLQEYHANNDVLSSSSKSARECLTETYQGYRAVANLVLAFVAFVELNVTAVRKILKKHDKNHPEHKLSRTYISTFTSAADSHLDQLYNYGGLSALVVTLNRAFSELHQMELNLQMMKEEIASQDSIGSEGVLMVAAHQDSMPADRMIDPSNMTITLERGPPQNLTCEITCQREPLLDKINAARRRLQKSTNYVEVVAAQALMFEDDDELDDSEGITEHPSGMSRAQKISSLLNLTSTFLYMANYYIVAPTTGQYALRLGSSEAMSGIIIGMTPNAALIATVLYGWWSNYSYKSALIFAACSSLVGNVCYAIALKHNSLFLVMAGRFLNGFGSARSINRRFIADTFSRSDRTAASAAFVTAGALGMATGPAIAALLGRVNFSEGNLLFTVETCPGWVMMGMWSVYAVCATLFFEEPDRSHLFGGKKTLELVLNKNKNGSKNGNGNSSSGESQPLLSSTSPTHEIVMAKTKEPPLYTNTPVMMVMWIYFVLKLVLESLLSSSATLTSFHFGWDAQLSGTFLAFLGLLMFPANMVVAKLSQRYEDRELIYVTLLVMFASVLGIIAYRPNHYGVVQYVVFGICVFLSTNILEGPNMSLLSKTIPKSWARGTFNSGFLATEAGTAARSVGDVLISAAATILGLSNLLNATFVPLLVLVLFTILLTRRYFDQMIEDDDDDESSRKSEPASRQASLNDD